MLDPFTPIASTSTSDLFNELHRRLTAVANEQNDSMLMLLATNIDGIHHDFEELQMQRPAEMRV